MTELHDRVIELSKKFGLSHNGSSLTCVGIIDEIYSLKQKDDPFILSCGHASLGLYVTIEKHKGIDAEKILSHHGTHPERCDQCGIYCSTGSLGHGLGIALGMAMADRDRDVWCLISDGEMFEGLIWEVANVMRRYLVTNLHVYLNFNGWSAYDEVRNWMIKNITTIMPSITVKMTNVEDYGLKGLSAHYVKL